MTGVISAFLPRQPLFYSVPGSEFLFFPAAHSFVWLFWNRPLFVSLYGVVLSLRINIAILFVGYFSQEKGFPFSPSRCWAFFLFAVFPACKSWEFQRVVIPASQFHFPYRNSSCLVTDDRSLWRNCCPLALPCPTSSFSCGENKIMFLFSFRLSQMSRSFGGSNAPRHFDVPVGPLNPFFYPFFLDFCCSPLSVPGDVPTLPQCFLRTFRDVLILPPSISLEILLSALAGRWIF